MRFTLARLKLTSSPAAALLSDTAQLDDIFWGLYSWLDAHPTETIVVSLKVDNGPDSVDVQNAVMNLVTSSPGSDYWLPATTPVSHLLH